MMRPWDSNSKNDKNNDNNKMTTTTITTTTTKTTTTTTIMVAMSITIEAVTVVDLMMINNLVSPTVLDWKD